MSIILSANYYQENKERLEKKACKRYQNYSKEEKEKKQHYGCEHYKIYQKLINKSLLNIEKNIIK